MGLGHHIPPPLIAAAPKLKWVQALTTGTETLTAPGVLPPHVLLTSTRGIHGPQMSELAFLNMIALNRNFRKMQRNQAEGKWEQWDQPILEGKTIVIVGLGILAEHLAERCKLFGMTVIGVSGGRASAPHFDEVHPRSELAKLAARADFLMLLVPYSPETHHLINRDVIAAMKPTAFLINLARGGVLDEAALIEHLQAGKIAGAGLDIFSKHAAAAGQSAVADAERHHHAQHRRPQRQVRRADDDGAGAEHSGLHRRPAEGHAQSRGALTAHPADAQSIEICAPPSPPGPRCPRSP